MNSNIIELPAVKTGRNLPAVREIDDPDLMVNYVESHPGHIARRQARRNAYYAAIARMQAENKKLTQIWGTVSMFAMLGVTVMGGLMGQP